MLWLKRFCKVGVLICYFVVIEFYKFFMIRFVLFVMSISLSPVLNQMILFLNFILVVLVLMLLLVLL